MTVRESVEFDEFSGPRGVPGIIGFTDLVVEAALAEDVGGGDATTSASVPPRLRASCRLVAKEDMVLAGLFVAERVFRSLDRKAKVESPYEDGDRVRKGRTIATVTGRMSSLLTGERVALNFLQRLCGVATITRRFVDRVNGTGTRILDTRKTTPCLRKLEKYAVAAGGGYNHRFGLFDQVLIKDNHIRAAGSIAAAVKGVRKKHGDRALVEVEVTNLKETREALAQSVDVIMLDNMTPARVAKALDVIGGRAMVEVSGGITLATVRDYAETGVDFISVGSLTHSAPAVDISMVVA